MDDFQISNLMLKLGPIADFQSLKKNKWITIIPKIKIYDKIQN